MAYRKTQLESIDRAPGKRITRGVQIGVMITGPKRREEMRIPAQKSPSNSPGWAGTEWCMCLLVMGQYVECLENCLRGLLNWGLGVRRPRWDLTTCLCWLALGSGFSQLPATRKESGHPRGTCGAILQPSKGPSAGSFPAVCKWDSYLPFPTPLPVHAHTLL